MSRLRAERGFALLIVLWSLVLLALLVTQLTVAGRIETLLAGNLRRAAEMEATADGLIYAAIFRLMNDDSAQRGDDGRDRLVRVPDGRATVRVTSLAGRVNPNTVSEDMLAGLLRQTGATPPQAARLAAAIADWRAPGQVARPLGAKAAEYRAAGLPYAPPGAPFQTVAEVGQVLGMTPALLARLAPHMTVFYPGDPARAAADPVVAGMLDGLGYGGDDDGVEGQAVNGAYAEIMVRVERDGGSAFSRRATVWAGHGAQRGRYLVLGWDVPPDG